jgi:hypothetical protein
MPRPLHGCQPRRGAGKQRRARPTVTDVGRWLMHALRAARMSVTEIAARFGCARSTVRRHIAMELAPAKRNTLARLKARLCPSSPIETWWTNMLANVSENASSRENDVKALWKQEWKVIRPQCVDCLVNSRRAKAVFRSKTMRTKRTKKN